MTSLFVNWQGNRKDPWTSQRTTWTNNKFCNNTLTVLQTLSSFHILFPVIDFATDLFFKSESIFSYLFHIEKIWKGWSRWLTRPPAGSQGTGGFTNTTGEGPPFHLLLKVHFTPHTRVSPPLGACVCAHRDTCSNARSAACVTTVASASQNEQTIPSRHPVISTSTAWALLSQIHAGGPQGAPLQPRLPPALPWACHRCPQAQDDSTALV